jgi:hypothetical protein
MKYKVRFSEGNDVRWQEICEKAVEQGYDVRILVPDVIILDDEEMTITQDRNGEEAPTVTLTIFEEALGEVEPEELIEVGPEDEEEVYETVINGGITNLECGNLMITTQVKELVYEKTDYMTKVKIG